MNSESLMSAHLNFLAALERLPRDRPSRDGRSPWPRYPDFLQRHWITADDYLTHVMVPFLDSEAGESRSISMWTRRFIGTAAFSSDPVSSNGRWREIAARSLQSGYVAYRSGIPDWH